MKRMFTQKEVNALITNAITEALENVSAKLYLHKIHLYDEDEEKGALISIISSKDDAYSSFTELQENLDKCVCINIAEDFSDGTVSLLNCSIENDNSNIKIKSKFYYDASDDSTGGEFIIYLTKIDEDIVVPL